MTATSGGNESNLLTGEGKSTRGKKLLKRGGEERRRGEGKHEETWKSEGVQKMRQGRGTVEGKG